MPNLDPWINQTVIKMKNRCGYKDNKLLEISGGWRIILIAVLK